MAEEAAAGAASHGPEWAPAGLLRWVEERLVKAVVLAERAAAALAVGARDPPPRLCADPEARARDVALGVAQRAGVFEPSDERARRGWLRTRGQRVASVVASTPAAANRLFGGDALDAAALDECVFTCDERIRRGVETKDVIAGTHARLRSLGAGGWEDATRDVASLESYMRCASAVGRKAWCMEGNRWCLELARATADVPVIVDVGSCYDPFRPEAELGDISLVAFDLCPAAASVHLGDFFAMRVGAPGGQPVVRPLGDGDPHAGAASTVLEELPAEHADAVVLSLVLSFVPGAVQRAEMCRKARQLLRLGGLLLIVTPFSTDRSSIGPHRALPVLQEWTSAIESLGFRSLKRQRLSCSNALAFEAVEPPLSPGPLVPMRIAYDDEAYDSVVNSEAMRVVQRLRDEPDGGEDEPPHKAKREDADGDEVDAAVLDGF